MPIYEEIWAGPGRNVKRVNGQPQLTSKWYITIHNTSNNATARAEANYAKVRTDGVGAHYFIDNIEVLQSTDTDWCVGHVGSTQGNSRGISYEITGVNGWTRTQWMANVAWDKLAAVIARDCTKYGIPVRLLTLDQMRAFSSSNKGFVTHNMCRLAWGGTTHTDPGPNFPMDHLLALVASALGGEADVNAEDVKDIWQHYLAPGGANMQDHLLGAEGAAVNAASGVKELLARPPVQSAPVDAAAIKAVLLDPEVLVAIAKAVADEDHKRSAN